jgi:hypothetical protein
MAPQFSGAASAAPFAWLRMTQLFSDAAGYRRARNPATMPSATPIARPTEA